MWFQVVWQVLVYDSFNSLRQVNEEPLFEIWVSSFELAKNTAEKKANELLLRKQINTKSSNILVAKVFALIDKNGTLYKLQER